MTITPFTNALNSFAEYLEYEFQAELALESSHLNLPERIHKPFSGIKFKGSPFFSRKMELFETYTAQVCREKLYPIINNTI